MKKVYTLAFLLLISIATSAQQDVYLKINHKINGAAFGYNTPTSNNLNTAFTFSRLQYYISEITLTYDGGNDTTLNDFYLLVDASVNVNKKIGTFKFSSLEAITLGIGVDSARNHLDPSAYLSDHALAPQSPSMHWGWAAGYRFVAAEGQTGPGMTQSWELHALGDKNYGYATIATTGDVMGNDLIIALDADYENALDNIKVNASLLIHGEDGESITILQNFQNHVFTKGGPDISLNEAHVLEFSMAPNPTTGRTQLTFNPIYPSGATITVTDLTGKVIAEEKVHQNKIDLHLKQSGVYLVSVSQNGKVQGTRKLIVH
jgi:hypothetical protein